MELLVSYLVVIIFRAFIEISADPIMLGGAAFIGVFSKQRFHVFLWSLALATGILTFIALLRGIHSGYTIIAVVLTAQIWGHLFFWIRQKYWPTASQSDRHPKAE